MITFSKLGSYGRFGNQLFQIASTMGIAIENGHDFCFPEWAYQKYFINKLPTGSPPNLKQVLEENYRYSLVRLDQNKNWDLVGYFQSWKYFNNCQATIRYFFDFLRPFSDGVAVHIRRGDYLTKPHIHPILPLTYYVDSMSLFGNENFTIFSDDVDWCKEYIKGYNINYHAPLGDDIEDFKIMTGYKKFIIANSSFSYWAAWLSGSDKVVAPINYVAGEEVDDRIPPYWTKR